MDRVVLVLLQIGAGFFGEAVAGHGDPCEERRADGPVNGPRHCGKGAGRGRSPPVKASESRADGEAGHSRAASGVTAIVAIAAESGSAAGRERECKYV